MELISSKSMKVGLCKNMKVYRKHIKLKWREVCELRVTVVYFFLPQVWDGIWED